MPVVLVRRQTTLYVIAVVGVLLLHASLCYPAATSRGHPPMTPAEIISVFLAPLAMLIPPFFDDGRNDFRARLVRAGLVASGFALVWGVVQANVTDVRPHIGHLAGVGGVVYYRSGEVFSGAVCCFFPSLVFFYCLDGVAIGLWSLVRKFQEEEPSNPAAAGRGGRETLRSDRST